MPEIISEYCSECICHEDGTRHPEGSGGGWTGGSPTWQFTSAWTGGSTTWQWTSAWNTGISWGQTTTESGNPGIDNGNTEQATQSACPQAENIADGYCDDPTNIESCNYDGGDCCNKNSVYVYCKECTCHPDAPQSPDDQSESLEENDENPIGCLTCESSSTTIVVNVGLFWNCLVIILTML